MKIECCKCGNGKYFGNVKDFEVDYSFSMGRNCMMLHIECLRCGYSWEELPLDKVNDTVKI